MCQFFKNPANARLERLGQYLQPGAYLWGEGVLVLQHTLAAVQFLAKL